MGVVVNVSYRGESFGGDGFVASCGNAEGRDGTPQKAMPARLLTAARSGFLTPAGGPKFATRRG